MMPANAIMPIMDVAVNCEPNIAWPGMTPMIVSGMAAMIGAFFILDDPIFNGLAISLIFGILVSTLLTLVVIPVLYYALFSKRMEKTQSKLV